MRNVTKRTSDRRQVRSERALPRINTHDIQSSRLATLLEKDIPAGELHQRKSAYMRERSATACSTPELLDAARNTRATRTWTRVQSTAELNIARSGTAAMVTTDNSIITSSTRKEYCVRRASRMLERAARCLQSAVSTSINLRQTSCVAWLDHFNHTIGSEEI